MNILCISTLTNVGNLHYKRELTILKALRIRGAIIDYYYCDGMNGVCDGLSEIDYSKCIICRDKAKEQAIEAGFNPHPLLETVKKEKYKLAEEWALKIPTTELHLAQFNDYDIGQWCLSSVLTHWRIPEFSHKDKEITEWYRSLVQHGLLLALATENVIKNNTYSSMIVYNARMAYTQIPFQIAKKHKIKTYTHERGKIQQHIGINLNAIPFDQTKKNAILRYWKNKPLYKNEIITTDEYLINRINGNQSALNWYNYTTAPGKHNEIFSKLKIQNTKIIWTLFTSSTHEIAALDGHKREGFKTQQEWIENCIIKIAKYPQIHLIIKLHPNYSNIVFKRLATQDIQYFNFLKRCLPENATIIDAFDKTSSYDLMDISNAGLCYMSTAGLEMAAKGKHVCIGSNAYYKELDIIDRAWTPEDIDQIFAKYASLPNNYKNQNIQKIAYRAIYALFFRSGFEFPFLHYPSPISANYAYFSQDHLSPGKHKQLDMICDTIISGGTMTFQQNDTDHSIDANDEDTLFLNTIDPGEISAEFRQSLRTKRTQYMTIPVIFVINNTKYSIRSLNALSRCELSEDTELHIFYNPHVDFEKIKTALMENQIFKEIIFHEASINNNLCSKIFYAIDILFNDHSSIIILDDEIYPAPQFLKFLNKAMYRYEHQSHVLCVNTSSTTASLTPEHPGADVTFLAEPNGMGFGIWRDRWTKLQFYNDKDASPPQQNTKENRAFLADFLKKSYRQLDAKCITPLIPHSCHCGSEGATCRKSFVHIPAEMRLPLFPNPTHRGQLVTNHLQSKTPNDTQNAKSLNHLHAIILALNKRKHPLLVNVGCGSRFHKDWINLDLLGNFSPVIPWDLHKNLPFPDGSCDAIYSCHSLEHFDQRDAKNLLFECRRVLKPNGILRIVVPDLENIAKTYLGCLEEVRHNPKDKEASARHKWMIIELVDQLSRHESGGVMARTWSQETLVAEDFIHQRMGHEFTNARTKLRGSQMNSNSPKDANQIGTFRLGGEPHQWMYDELSLRELLIQCDFKNITRCEFYQSKIQNFSEYGLDIMPDGKEYRPFSLYIEATP